MVTYKIARIVCGRRISILTTIHLYGSRTRVLRKAKLTGHRGKGPLKVRRMVLMSPTTTLFLEQRLEMVFPS